ncbi:MAG: ABC transporter permease/substrate-binding protein [Spirochaetaceae bacterium]|jgi:osmoprotectant transport system permease protein|nr:ABC transporter permease/substrate-binding protein [Spirochaetaceae bacterium]
MVQYALHNSGEIVRLLLEHCRLTLIAVLLAVFIGVPLGIAISYLKKLSPPILGAANVAQAVPSLALLGFLIPFLGIGFKPAVFMVVVYSLLPIIKNTAAGLENIPRDLTEAATGIGMTPRQVLFKVKLPLALPVIMAGVRISAVTAVGLVTIAAFIGAGGLGYLVYSGIRTVNTAQILAGAVPACLLALCIDFLAARIERLVSPIHLRPDIQTLDTKRFRRRQRLALGASALGFSAFIIIVFFSIISPDGAGAGKRERTLVVAAKDFTEQNLLGEIYAQLIEKKTAIQVVRKMDLGGTQIIFGALKKGEVDIYVEYLGTAYNSILQQSEYRTTEEIYAFVEKELGERHGVIMFPALGFNNTYALAVRPETAREHRLASISDLAQASRGAPVFRFSPTLEFMNRFDGMQGLLLRYDLRFKDIIPLDGAPRYTALMNNQSDVIDAFSTDGLLKAFDLVVLEDDLRHFPPYDALPLVRPELLKKFPELAPVIESLAGQIDDEAMRDLNYEVDVLKKKPEAVARSFINSLRLF